MFLYTRKEKPEDVPTQEDVDRWPYLQMAVGLLMGTNAPLASEPWEVVHSQDDGPRKLYTGGQFEVRSEAIRRIFTRHRTHL